MGKMRAALRGAVVVALAGSAAAAAAIAAPITFNTALPVTKGHGVVRVQPTYLRFASDPTLLDREMTVWAVPLVGGYGVSQRLALFGVLPILEKELEIATAGGRRTRHASGLGDALLLARYTAYQRDDPHGTLRLAPFAGVKLPTGKDNERDAQGPLPPALQLGSGSWDVPLGVVLTRQTLAWQVDASPSYQFNREAQGFQSGDEARFDLSYQRRLWPRELGAGVPGFLFGVLESNFVWQDHSRRAGAEDPDSGGTTWYLTPGIQYITKRFVWDAAVQVPVSQNPNGRGLESDLVATLSVRANL